MKNMYSVDYQFYPQLVTKLTKHQELHQHKILIKITTETITCTTITTSDTAAAT